MFVTKVIAVASLAGAALLLGGCGSSRAVSFSKDVHPILEHNCAVCHSPGGVGYKVSGFSVASYASIMKGSKYGPLVVPGSAKESDLLWLLKHGAHPSMNMPKICEKLAQTGGKCEIPSQYARELPATKVAVIAKWVDQGAKDN